MKNKIRNFLALWCGLFFLILPLESYALFNIIIGALVSSLAAKVALKLTFMVTMKLFAIQTIGGLLLSALAPKPKKFDMTDGFAIMSNTRHPISSQVWVYGTCRVGGVVVYEEATDDNDTLWRIIVLAAHEVHSIPKIYLFDEEVTLDSDGNVTRPSRWRDKIKITKYLGTETQNVDGGLHEASASLWTNRHKLQGMACLVCKFEFDIDAFPNGIPVVTALVAGRKVFDPRTNTTAYSNNWALCVRDFLVNHPQLESTINQVNEDSVKAAADISDQSITIRNRTYSRYTIDGAITIADTSIKVVLENMARAGAGDIWIESGVWNLLAGHLPTVKKELSEFVAPLSVTSAVGRAERFNKVRGTFRGAETHWQDTDYPEVTSSVFLALDNYVDSTVDVNFPFVTNSAKCQQLAKIILYKMREELVVNCKVNLNGFDLSIGDVVTVSYERFGWQSKMFQVRNWEYVIDEGESLVVDMTLREISAGVYDYYADVKEFDLNNTTLPSPFHSVPVGIEWSQEMRLLNQEVFGVLKVTVSVTSPRLVSYYEVEIRTPQNDNWHLLGSGSSNYYEYHALESSTIHLRARSVSALGVRSEWTVLENIAVDLIVDPPADVTGFRYAGTAEHLHLNWDPIDNDALSHYEIRYHPDSTGSWEDADILVAKVGRPATGKSAPHRKGKYLIKAVDKLGFESVSASSVFVASEISTHLETSLEWSSTQWSWSYQPSSGGNMRHFDNFDVSEITNNNILTLRNPPFSSSGTVVYPVTAYWQEGGPFADPPYNYARLDLEAVRTALIRVELEQDIERLDSVNWDELIGNWDSFVGSWDNWGVSGHDIGEGTGIEAQIRYANDEGAGLVAATWQKWTEGIITARYIIVRLKFTATSPKSRPRALSLKLSALLPYVTETGKNVASTTAGAGLTVNFSEPFYEPPAVMITPLNLDRWDFYNVTNVTKTGFNIRFRTSGYAVISRNFNWTAYGAR